MAGQHWTQGFIQHMIFGDTIPSIVIYYETLLLTKTIINFYLSLRSVPRASQTSELYHHHYNHLKNIFKNNFGISLPNSHTPLDMSLAPLSCQQNKTLGSFTPRVLSLFILTHEKCNTFLL